MKKLALDTLVLKSFVTRIEGRQTVGGLTFGCASEENCPTGLMCETVNTCNTFSPECPTYLC